MNLHEPDETAPDQTASGQTERASASESVAETPSQPAMAGTPPTQRTTRLHLDRTLHELESALNDWDALVPSPQTSSLIAEKSPEKKAEEAEFKKRTKLLLDELRRQLAEL